ncbi:hypothetical protein TNCV_4741901 [Trichonephila clavipes]|nr:hypothetical protein TNCV_4741901 [Trichonephila clavipes]
MYNAFEAWGTLNSRRAESPLVRLVEGEKEARKIETLTKISADYLLELLHRKNHLLVNHCFQMVGSLITPKPLEE